MMEPIQIILKGFDLAVTKCNYGESVFLGIEIINTYLSD